MGGILSWMSGEADRQADPSEVGAPLSGPAERLATTPSSTVYNVNHIASEQAIQTDIAYTTFSSAIATRDETKNMDVRQTAV